MNISFGGLLSAYVFCRMKMINERQSVKQKGREQQQQQQKHSAQHVNEISMKRQWILVSFAEWILWSMTGVHFRHIAVWIVAKLGQSIQADVCLEFNRWHSIKWNIYTPFKFNSINSWMHSTKTRDWQCIWPAMCPFKLNKVKNIFNDLTWNRRRKKYKLCDRFVVVRKLC